MKDSLLNTGQVVLRSLLAMMVQGIEERVLVIKDSLLNAGQVVLRSSLAVMAQSIEEWVLVRRTHC